jgi:hypothetical protein
LEKDGSDCCEKAFSELGGFGTAATLARSFTLEDAQHAIPKFMRMQGFTVDHEAPLLFARHRKAMNVWEKDVIQGEQVPPLADMSLYPRWVKPLTRLACVVVMSCYYAQTSGTLLMHIGNRLITKLLCACCLAMQLIAPVTSVASLIVLFSDLEMTRAWCRGQERAWRKLWGLGVHPKGHTSDKPPAFPRSSGGGAGGGGGGGGDSGSSTSSNHHAELPSWFACPWNDDTALLSQMRDADEDERDVDVVDG